MTRAIGTSDSGDAVDTSYLLATFEPGDAPATEDPIPQAISDVVGAALTESLRTGAPPTAVGAGLQFADAANWVDYNLTEPLEPNAEYRFVMQRGASANAITVTESFTGSLLLDLPDVAAGTAYSADTEDNILNLVFGRNQAVGALALSVGHRGSADKTAVSALLLRVQDTTYRVKAMQKLPPRLVAASDAAGTGLTEDQARDVAGALLASLGPFGYNAATNTLTFALRDGDIPAEISRDADVSTAINNLRDLLRGGVAADRDTLKELADAIAAIMAGATWLAPSGNAPAGGADGQWALRTGAVDPGIYYRAGGVWSLVFGPPDLSGYAQLAGATFTGEVNVPDPTDADHAANMRYVDENAHDSSAAGSSSDDHRRIERLEHLTQDLSVQELEGWADAEAADVPNFAIFLNDSSSSLVTNEIAGYAWAQSFAVNADGTYRILIRLREGQRLTGARAVATLQAGGTRTFEGLWDKTRSTPGFISEHTQGGFVYYEWSAYFDFVVGDTVAIQHASIVEEHTEYAGELPALDRHAARPYAHQDSPPRVAHLQIGAPVGRQVYLTEPFDIPATEHIYTVSPSEIDGDFVGASVADFSSIGGPTQVVGAAYPDILNVARVSGIWQQERGLGHLTRPIFVAVLGSIGTPSHLHVAEPLLNERFAITQDPDNPTINLGGRVHRIMRTEAIRDQAFLETLENRRDFQFSLEYPTGYLADDGTIDAGTTQAAGHYESLGGGRWRGRNANLIEAIKAALAAASDADKFAIVAGLRAEEQLFRDNAARVYTKAFNTINLGREIVEADDDKLMRFHFQNGEVETYFDILARTYRLIPHQDATGNSDARVIGHVIVDGDADEHDDAGQRPVYVSRLQRDPVSTQRLLIGSDAFGDRQQTEWRALTLTISLRSLV